MTPSAAAAAGWPTAASAAAGTASRGAGTGRRSARWRAVAGGRSARRRAIAGLAGPVLRCAVLRRAGARRISGAAEPSIPAAGLRLRLRRPGILHRGTLTSPPPGVASLRSVRRRAARLGSRIAEATESAAAASRSSTGAVASIHRRRLRALGSGWPVVGEATSRTCGWSRAGKPTSLLHGALLLGERHSLRRRLAADACRIVVDADVRGVNAAARDPYCRLPRLGAIPTWSLDQPGRSATAHPWMDRFAEPAVLEILCSYRGNTIGHTSVSVDVAIFTFVIFMPRLKPP